MAPSFVLPVRLLLLAHALKGLHIVFYVHETPRVGITLHVVTRRGLGLRSFTDSTITVPVPFRWIGCHSRFLVEEL